MASVRVQYKDYIVNVKLSKEDDKIVQVITPPDVPEGTALTDEQAELQDMHGTLCRTLVSRPHTDYFKNAKRDLGKDFLRHVPEALRKSICWQVQKINALGEIVGTSKFINLAGLEAYADTINADWYLMPTGTARVKVETKAVEPIQHNFGWNNAVVSAKEETPTKTKAK